MVGLKERFPFPRHIVNLLLLNSLLFKSRDITVFYPSLYIHKELTYFWINVETSHRANAILKNNKVYKFKIMKKDNNLDSLEKYSLAKKKALFKYNYNFGGDLVCCKQDGEGGALNS